VNYTGIEKLPKFLACAVRTIVYAIFAGHQTHAIMSFSGKIILIPFFIIFVACSQPDSGEEKPIFDDQSRHVLLMHPTVNNLKTFIYLTENDIFTLPEGYRAVGVYHESAAYNYQQSLDFLKEQNNENITLYPLTPKVDPSTLFMNNELSESFRMLFDKSEGIIFFGGPDIPPAVYGEQTNLLTIITDPHRHYHELSFLFHLLGGYQDEGFKPFLEDRPDYRILGICLGMQTMNVATGGSMYQDIPTQLYGIKTIEEILYQSHDQQHRNYFTNLMPDDVVGPDNYHPILIKEGSILHAIAGNSKSQPYVLSSHHQALKEIGKGWKVTALSVDSLVVEAIEHEKYPNVIGVQFHPEVRDLYQDHPLELVPGEPGKSFLETYPGEKGEDFHFGFWKYMGEIYNN
jgi:putative glutamine amidotransferase